MNRFYRKIYILLLCAVILPVLAGCKESEAFRQNVYNQDDPDVSDVDRMIDNQEDNEEEDQDIFSKDERDDAQTERHYQRSEAVTDDSEDNAASGLAALFKKLAEAFGVAEGGAAPTPSSGTTDGTSNTAEIPGLNEEEDSDSSLIAGQGSGSLIKSGSYEQNARAVSYGEVIATGEAAVLVQMLGGAGALAATDAQTLDAMGEFFPAEELGEILVLWAGDPEEGLDADLLEELTEEKALPEYCLLDASALDESDVVLLNQAGITCQAISFDSYDNMVLSAETVASLIGTGRAKEQAEAYVTFCSGIQELVSEYTSQKYTLYVSEWDEDARLTINTKSGTWESVNGLAVAVNGKLWSSPAGDMWDLAGVNNNYNTSSKNYRGGSYINNSGLLNDQCAYICQFFCLAYTTARTNMAYKIELNSNVLAYGLGESAYPALVVDSREIRDALLADKNYSDSAQSGGMMSVYPGALTVNDTLTQATAYITRDYEVYVNPRGLGDWIEGSAESILEAAWAAWRFQGTLTEEQVREAVQEYYETFYRCSLADEQIDEILAGKES